MLLTSNQAIIFSCGPTVVVLSWLQHCPSCWKRFVGNRVAEIPSLTSVEHMTVLLIMYAVALIHSF
jgi:hypothetical protein